ncbi:heterokaryon incompatibility protein-domain-containing protein [Truncatella angustata]|uniref:Heterokaryon incompatibility protein-domain-containing protein n=1 Tax=Truncatella angustata TaxID=152316 RepID=A0A9P8RNF5_9PEZI|nr:heterokaryon incompatibility protein-domain-containing protein [Truncatella angustata]KAH6646376.1 heterokaryon incompatibility protein-domain-containing protein [Truncatella angustata]
MEYRPLPSTQAKDPLVCDVLYVSLSDSSLYTALSYCWGHGDLSGRIFVAGTQVRIDKNLSDALVEFRRRGHLAVWADALCIDQSGFDERDLQVLLMSNIYRGAHTVIAWLGSGGSSAADDRQQIESSLLRIEAVSKAARDVLCSREPLSSMLEAEILQAWPILSDILRAEYWSRVWIIQELCVGMSLQLLWNRYLIDLNDINDMYSIMLAYRKIKGIVNGAPDVPGHHVQQLVIMRQKVANLTRDRPSLIEYLSRSHLAKATDQRDKVFALLGVSRDGMDIFPAPSYTMPLDKLNFNAAQRLLRSTGSLDPFVFKSIPPGTWIPDWFERRLGRRNVFRIDCSATLQEAASTPLQWPAGIIPGPPTGEPPNTHNPLDSLFKLMVVLRPVKDDRPRQIYENEFLFFSKALRTEDDPEWLQLHFPELHAWLRGELNTQFKINGHTIGDRFTQPDAASLWRLVSHTWQDYRAKGYLGSLVPIKNYHRRLREADRYPLCFINYHPVGGSS